MLCWTSRTPTILRPTDTKSNGQLGAFGVRIPARFVASLWQAVAESRGTIQFNDRHFEPRSDAKRAINSPNRLWPQFAAGTENDTRNGQNQLAASGN
jgi:hypothetical protein